MDYVMQNVPLICTLVGVAGVLFAIMLATIVKGAPAGDEKMQNIANAIKEGAVAYLNRQMKSMGIAGIIIFAVIFATMGAKTAIGFALGAIASFLAGYIGMRVSVLANVRTAQAAKKGMSAGLSMAFKGGSVTGMIVAGLALTAVAGYYTITHDVIALVALGFGGSAIFARIGLEHMRSTTGTLVSLIAGTIVIMVIAFILHSDDIFSLAGAAFLWFLLSGIINFPMGLLLNYTGVSLAGVSKATPLIGTAPLFATVFAVTVGGESITIPTLIGTLLIVGGGGLILSQR